MATVVMRDAELLNRFCIPRDDRQGWGFALLLTVVGALFLRPADIVPAFDALPVYQFLIVTSLLVSFRATLRQFAQRRLLEQPVTLCLLVLLLAVGSSHLSHGSTWHARRSMFEFSKLLALYVLVAGLVNTPQRLFIFTKWLTIAITTVAAIALLDRYEVISIAALAPIQDHGVPQGGRQIAVERIRGTGIFQDPNDFGLVLVTGLILCASFLLKPHAGWPRYTWLVPAGVLLSALALTHSRGAMLSLMCAPPAALCYIRGGRHGKWALLGLPLLTLVFSERMTDVDAIHDGTGQSRLQIWSESLTVWRRHPFFGLGEGTLADEIGMASHNSFLHCYAELGLFGGTAFVGSFAAAGMGLWSLRRHTSAATLQGPVSAEAYEHSRRSGFIFAALVAYVAGTLTVSRQFVAPTYLLLGLATAASAVSVVACESAVWRISIRSLMVASLLGVLPLLAFYVVVRLFVRW